MRTSMGDRTRWLAAAIACTLLLSGCARKMVHSAPSPVPRSAENASARPVPPPGAFASLTLPPGDGKGGYRTVNSDISDVEAVWHLRSALNVAALSCDRSGKLGIAANYNKLLGSQRASLAAAYRAEGARFGAAAKADAHITQIYNFFAQPFAQTRFCAAAADVAAEARALPPDSLAGFAPAALDRLTAPFAAFYDAFARYRVEMAAWEKGDHLPVQAQLRLAAAPQPAGPPWRIQLGAYSGQRAAQDAWGRIRQRMKGAGDFEPRFEGVPDSRLIRVRVGPVADRSEAIALCAAAAGAGLDCLPVPPKA